MDATRTTPPIRAVIAAGAMSIVSLMGSSCSTTASAQPPATTITTTSTSTSSTSTTSSTPPQPAVAQTTTTTAAPAAPATGCWTDLARQVGWPEHTLGHLAHIIHRESRCDPTQLADRPWTRDLSRGLLQINAYDYLDAGIRDLCGIDPVELFDPAVNLTCGLELYRAYGWQPWGG